MKDKTPESSHIKYPEVLPWTDLVALHGVPEGTNPMVFEGGAKNLGHIMTWDDLIFRLPGFEDISNVTFTMECCAGSIATGRWEVVCRAAPSSEDMIASGHAIPDDTGQQGGSGDEYVGTFGGSRITHFKKMSVRTALSLDKLKGDYPEYMWGWHYVEISMPLKSIRVVGNLYS
jgi:hypothetical protein